MNAKYAILLLSFFFVFFYSCNKLDDTYEKESKILAVTKDSEISTRDAEIKEFEPQIVFTGNDIAWFDLRTRELKFNTIKPEPFSIPMYSQIDIKVGNETVFTIVAYINESVDRAYDDLVLLFDLEDFKYYLLDSYPSYWSPETTKKNIQNRASGWNKFINQLKEENKLKE